MSEARGADASAPTAVTASAALEVADLSAGYGPVTILRSVNLRVAPGEVVALLGANGAGKTTCCGRPRGSCGRAAAAYSSAARM